MSSVRRNLRRLFVLSACVAGLLTLSSLGEARNKTKNIDLLVKFTSEASLNAQLMSKLSSQGIRVETMMPQWVHLQASSEKLNAQTIEALKNDPQVEYVQPNYAIRLMHDYRIQDPLIRAAYAKSLSRKAIKPAPMKDNPPLPLTVPKQVAGADPLFKNQWGMNDIGAADGWKLNQARSKVIVAVIDTGVDYNHEDLMPSLWRNAGETGLDAKGNPKETNGIDDDGNGYVDDVIGWDFASNDNKPFDLAVDPSQIIITGGNPGHGTHCAGNVAAHYNNSLGIAGVAPEAQIMAMRFLTEKGEGTTLNAIKSIKYAVDNGATVLSNSWGSEGEDPSEDKENRALRDMVQYAQDHGVLFIAAAGNGHQGSGYDNDTDKKPGYPASYDHENIISVAALDVKDQLGSFSNWGAKSVDLGAPGVAVYSTMVNNKYSDKVFDMGGFEITWDGTSMATPHVAGAAALYWSAHPDKNWREVKAAILGNVRKINSLAGKTVTGGKLDVKALLSDKH